jgi:hypothetical protein
MTRDSFTLAELDEATAGRVDIVRNLLNEAGYVPMLKEDTDPGHQVSRAWLVEVYDRCRASGWSLAEDLALLLGLSPALPAPAPRPSYEPIGGLSLGSVRLEPPRDADDLVCRFCGKALGSEVWAEAESDGRGGLYWTAPICYSCRTRKAGRETDAERAGRMVTQTAQMAELAPKPEPRPRQRLRRRREPSGKKPEE